ncbi:hypothetical protein [Cupriavidus sp. Marseille-Q8015]
MTGMLPAAMAASARWLSPQGATDEEPLAEEESHAEHVAQRRQCGGRRGARRAAAEGRRQTAMATAAMTKAATDAWLAALTPPGPARKRPARRRGK